MKRHKPLRPGKPLARTELKRGDCELKRSTRLRPVSAKRAAENRQRKRMLEEVYGSDLLVCEVPWCSNVADDPHEPLTRARGGSITDPDNIAILCRPCHRVITDEEPAWAYRYDLLIHSWDTRTLAELAADRRAKLAAWTGEAA